ncbi:MAG: hypothetical protein DMG31_00515 [Acidobacteria bacterium]|nr:MAG: hypothetical protein DMG31_00515 [Acidobacteriota bacterium]
MDYAQASRGTHPTEIQLPCGRNRRGGDAALKDAVPPQFVERARTMVWESMGILAGTRGAFAATKSSTSLHL